MATPIEIVIVLFDGKEMPLENIHVLINREPNKHDTATITGHMKADIYDKYAYIASESSEVEIQFTEDKAEILKFCGIIDNIEVRSEGVKEGAVYHIFVESSAHTKKLDIKKIKKSFQDEKQSLENEIWELLEPYPNADFKNEIIGADAAGCFRLVYHETAYEYIIRRASRFNMPVICVSNLNRARFRLGINTYPYKGNLEQYEYTVGKNVKAYRIAEQNGYYDDIDELDFVTYKIHLRENEQPLDIGDLITYNETSLIVKEVQIEIKDNFRYCTYTLGIQNCLKVKWQFNEQIIGISIIGKVIDVEHNVLKLHLEIDETQDVNKAWWFGYLTSYSSKYVMPEINDYVNLYFPNHTEESAIGLNSLKQNPEGGYMRTNEPPQYPLGKGSAILDFVKEAHNPSTKMFVNKYGIAVAITDRAVKVVLNDDNYIIVDKEEGITIHSNEHIHVQADKDITLKAQKNIRMEAKDQILVHSGTSKVELLPELIKIRSEETDMN